MNPKVKTEWIACLRDGSYKQGKGQLRDLGDHYDAIGVLMDRAAAAGVIAEPEKRDKASGARLFFGWLYDHSATRMTKAVEDWSGLSYWQAHRIINMNDDGKTFAEIADYVEAEL